MKILGFLIPFLFLNKVYANPTSESHFHLPKTICHYEENEKLDSAPQSPPLVVDDPATPGCNKWEINVVMSADYTKLERHYELPLLDINYGIGDDIQLKYEVPNSVLEEQEGTRRGIGESNIGIKYKFFEDLSTDTQIALYPQYQFVTPSSNSEEMGNHDKGVIIALPLLISRRVGKNSRGDIIMTSNLGYHFSTQSEVSNYMSAAIGLGLPINSRLSMMAELNSENSFVNNSVGFREQIYRADIGFITTFVKHALLFGSFGQSLYSADGQNHTYFLAGVRIQELSSLIFW